jgi:putative CocE/NonD family hydrolase
MSADPAIRTEFPFEVQTIDPYWIVLEDGTRIAGTLWRPVTRDPVAVVTEMIPYRRRDGTLFRDEEIHPYIAGHGIACLRIDLRGSGDSDGFLLDEYLPGEQDDACAIIAHLARQSWCNGNVGMTGISWGGFNALQVAARRPPALKAILALCCSDDRYADDVHYMGGALLTENEMWSNFMLANCSMPPDPQVVGSRWREMWLARLAATCSWSEHWLAHQRRDAYWRQGSVCENLSDIRCAVMAVGGWDDSYSNAVPRLLQGLTCPRLGIVGPWTHTYPCRGDPGPRIGFLQEAVRWWKHWLCGEDTGIMSEPLYRIWITGEERPRPWYKDHAGQWAAEAQWPSPRIAWQTLHLNASGLERTARDGTDLVLSSPCTAGTDFGRWGGYGGTSPDLAIDQRREDGQSLCFDTAPLDEDLVLMGAVEAELEISVDKPAATLALRLCDVYPDGTAAVITYGVLNLTHRNSHARPEPCPVDRPFRVTISFNDFARRLPKGHRLRLAIQTQFWFVLWPQPEKPTVTLRSGASTVKLPVRPDSPLDRQVRFAPAETCTPITATVTREAGASKSIEDDLATGLRRIRLVNDFGGWRIAARNIGGSARSVDQFTIHPDDPLSARLHTTYDWTMESGPLRASGLAETQLTADATHFHLTWQIEVSEGDTVIHRAGREISFPRDHC